MSKAILTSLAFLFVFSIITVSANVALATGPGGCEPDDEFCIDNYYANQSGGGGGGTINTLYDAIAAAKDIVYFLMPFIVILAVLTILWGVFGYITHGDEEEKRAEGKKFILWGIIGLFVMVSIWGLVNVLGSTFRLNNDAPPNSMPALPAIPGA